MNTTTATVKTRKCLAKCIDAKPHSDCDCTCGRTCHGMGACDPMTHRYAANGTAGPRYAR
jgi:hypothetical protein